MADPHYNGTSASGSSTKRCEYCGKENNEAALACYGCGTPFSEDHSQTENSSVGVPLELNARSATFVLFITIAGQIGASFVVGLVLTLAAGIAQPIAGTPDRSDRHAAVVQRIMPPAIVAAMIGGGAAMLAASRGKVRASLCDRSPVGAAWAVGSPRQIAIGAGLGPLVALAFLVLASIPALRPIHITPGPLTRMAMTPGLPRILWVTTAVLLAPPIEELLFRGVLYGGYCRSFGPTKAALLSTLIFCALHITEIIRFPVGAFAIGGMAVTALRMRLRSSAIGPAVAVHLSYNGTLVLIQLMASHAQM